MQANFDRVAGVYRWAEYLALGPELRRTREALLPAMVLCRTALLLGDGDGRFAAALLRAAPAMQMVAVDSSGEMLRRLRRRCARDGHGNRIRAEQASVLDVRPPPECDLVVAHFVLDCLEQGEVNALAQRLRKQVMAGTFWVVSDFDLPRQPMLRLLARVYVRLLYAAFRVLTGLRVQHLPNVGEALRTAGWYRLQRRERLWGLLYSELWQAGAVLEKRGDAGATSAPARTST